MAIAPLVVVLAGPNGAGKSTSAAHLLRGALAVDEFVNADTIAQGLSAYRPESAAITAGRVMLDRLRFLVRERRDFAFETTLARTPSDDISFLTGIGPETDRISAENLRVHPAFLSAKKIRNQLVDAAEVALSDDPAGGHVPQAHEHG